MIMKWNDNNEVLICNNMIMIMKWINNNDNNK